MMDVRSPLLPPAPQRKILLTALSLVVVLALAIGWVSPARHVLLFLTGTALGVVLYQSVFGFTSAFRVLLADRRSAGFRAQMVMLGAACILFFPVLARGTLWGQAVVGFVSPVGASVAIGAFLFGIGMQLGGGCASGTLYALGGGSTRMLLTLLFFIVGSVIGLTHLAWWERLPGIAPVSLIARWGWPAALVMNLAVFSAAYAVVARLERARHGALESISHRPLSAGVTTCGLGRSGRLLSTLCGAWPLLAGALALAGLNFVTLGLAGRPWGITSAYSLWGGMALQAAGVPVTNWPGYALPDMQAALQRSPLADITSVMDLGIILGALLAAGAGGHFKPVWSISPGQLAASVVGGLLLGYGARLGYGCNIGAFFSGIASGSLHGWLWIVFALVGTWAALLIRPAFGLDQASPLKPKI